MTEAFRDPPIHLNVQNETNTLKTVILGVAEDWGAQLDINPVSKSHIEAGTYPKEDDAIKELQSFESALKANGVEVLRPENLSGVEQIFARDIGFVIDDKFIIAKMKEPVRQRELPGIQYILGRIGEENIIRTPDDVTVEGGDVILWNDNIFVGISSRTNTKAIGFLKDTFPDKNIHPIPLTLSEDPNVHVLHLDCTFQPIGEDEAIIYKNGFASEPEAIYDLFPPDKLIEVTQEEKASMFPNVLSIGPKKVVIERNFHRLKDELEEREYEVIPVDFKETSKLSGLLRCATLPLKRA